MSNAYSRGDFAADRRLIRNSAMAACIGLGSTVAAWALLDLIHLFTNVFFFQTFSLAARSPGVNTLGPWVIALPVVGGLIVGLMARFGTDKIRGHGIPEAIEAILFGKSRMSPKVAVFKPLSSGIVIGSGGPFGAEGPIIMTGGALGSLLGQYFELSAAERKTLLVAGATAGMTAVFGTPVAAVLLGTELLLFEWRPRSLLPVAIACAAAAFARPYLLEAGPLFPLHTAAPAGIALVSCIVLGVICGAIASVLSHALYRIEDAFHKLPVHWMWWPALGGIAVGIGGYFEPRALGVGYDVIGDLLHHNLLLGAVAALLLVKAVIWLIALGSGTSGGVLAPVLMLGAGTGLLLSPMLPGGEAGLWPLVGMAAMLSATLGTPLTAIVFAFGLTHDSNALLPLLAACATAYGFVVLVMPRSIMTEKIARRGRHIYREYSVDPLERHAVGEVMSQDAVCIDAAVTVDIANRDHFGVTQTRRAYPVVRDGRVLGIVDKPAIDAALRDPAVGPLATLGTLVAATPLRYALPDETCRAVAARMVLHGLERLPVVVGANDAHLLGIVSRSDLAKPAIVYFHEEETRERLRGAALGPRISLAGKQEG